MVGAWVCNLHAQWKKNRVHIMLLQAHMLQTLPHRTLYTTAASKKTFFTALR